MSDEHKQTTAPVRWLKIEREGLSYKIEAIVKDCISYAIATSIAVFGLGVILAPSMGALLVQCIGCLVLMWPTLMFSVFAIHPSSFYFIFLAMIYTTILLCAAVVSDGLFVIVFGLMSFLFLGNYFDGPRVGVNLEESLPPGLVLSIVAILALTYKHLVQVGPSVEFLPGEVDMKSLNAIERSIVDASSTMIEVLRESSDGKISFECPEETGIFAGQTCTISNSTTSYDNPAALTASVNGGLYIVAAFWTGMGLDNPFALLYNLIIGTCWMVIALALPIFIPPVRRFRDVLRSLIIPGTLSGVAAMLESKSKEETHVAGDESNPFMAEKQTLSAIAKKLSPKKNAGLLYFEPRLCHVPTIDHIPYMEAFLNNIQSAVLVLYNYSGYRSESNEQPDHSQTIQVLRTVATAVKENDLSILEGVDAKPINWGDTEGGLHELSLSEIIGDIASSIYSSSRVWLKAYNDIDIKEEEKNRVTVVHRTMRAWLTNAFCACSNITSSWPFIAIRLLLGKQGADLQNMSTRRFIMTIIWSLKWTVGAVALTCVEIYGKGFHADWLVRQEMGSNTNYVVIGTLQGWVLFSYFLAFQFSMEGTIKKGLLRALGTCVGGFASWIGIMLCSLSYNGSSPVNPYAWVAYLTVCQFIGNFAGKGTGMAAFLGWDYDMPFFSFYFNLTLNIVGMGAYYGYYSVNSGTVNRILVNLVMLVSITPPYYSGKDPTWLIDYCEELQKFHRSLAHEFIENRDISMDSIVQMADDLENRRKKAAMVLTDASRWSALPYFRTPPELLKIMDILTAEEGH